MAKRAEDVRVPAGKALVTEGETGHEFFVILEGQAKVTRHGRKVATIGPGDAFGELALLEKAPRNSTVVAETDMELSSSASASSPASSTRCRASRASCSRAWRTGSAKPTPAVRAVAARAPTRQAGFRDRRATRFPPVRRPRPHQIVLAIGILAAIFAIASGIAPAITGWEHVLADRAPGLHRRPDRAEGRVLRRRSRRCSSSSRGSRRSASGTTSAAPPTTAARPARTPSAVGGLPLRRVDADAAARPCRRRHALVHLLRIHRPVHRHRDAARSTTSCPARSSSCTARPTRLTRRPPISPASCSSSGIGWAIVRRYVQRPYRIRIKTKPEDAVILGTFLVHRRDRVLRRGAAHRARSAVRRSRSGRSSGTRSRAW